MGISVNKTLFGGLLRSYQRRAGVRQNALAAALGISPSAMSQMMSGRLVPNPEQLETLGDMLRLERSELAGLRDQLTRIRSGNCEGSTAINDFIRSARLRCGYTLEKLADVTGIPVADLESFETHIGARPTPTEAVRLGAVLGCELNDLCRTAEELSSITYTLHPEVRRRPAELLHDNTVPYHPFSTVSRAPLVRGAVLLAYVPGKDFPMDYCWRHMDMIVESSVPGIVVVRAAGRELGLMPNLFLELEVVPGGACATGMLVLGMGENELLLGEMTERGEIRTLDGRSAGCRFAWPIRQFRGESMPQVALEQMQKWGADGGENHGGQ